MLAEAYAAYLNTLPRTTIIPEAKNGEVYARHEASDSGYDAGSSRLEHR